MEISVLDFLKEYSQVLIPIATFILGFILSRFTLSKNEQLAHEQRQFENGKELMEAQKHQFQTFTSALQKYINKKEEPTLDDFFDISTSGENYFYQLKITSDAILAGKVTKDARDSTLVPAIKEALVKSLPTFYKTLQSIAKKKNINYRGKLERKNYESLYSVVEKYAHKRGRRE